MSIETELREALAARADQVDPTPADPYVRVTGAIAASRRRRRTVGAGTLAAVTALAVATPLLWPGDDRAAPPARHTRTVVPGPGDARWNAMATWPTRGDLSGDASLIASVRESSLASTVLYAADLPSSRMVVTWQPEEGSESGMVRLFLGPRGAPAAGLAEVASSQPPTRDLVVVRERMANDGQLVLLTTPRTTSAAVSPTATIAPDGSVTRSAYRQVPLVDGVWSEPVEDSPAFLARVRVGDYEGQATMLMGPADARTEEAAICLGCTGEDFRRRAEAATSQNVATTLGVDPSEVTTRTVYHGPVDRVVAGRAGVTEATSGEVDVNLYVADSTLRGGQVLRSALVVTSSRDGSAASTLEIGSGVPIDATTSADRPFVLRGPVQGTPEMSVQVFAPGAARVQLVSDVPSLHPSSATVPTAQGTAVLRVTAWETATAPYRVTTFDAAGRRIGLWPLDLSTSADPFAGTPAR